MLSRCAAVVLFLFLISGKSLAQPDSTLQKLVNDFTADPVFAHASVGFLAIDCSDGRVLASVNPAVSLPPASTVKLFTTATALETIGKDYTPKTRFYIDGTLKDSIVQGDLWVRGGGDPSLGSRYYNDDGREPAFLEMITDTLKKLGIRQINGAIIADASEFGYQGTPDGWTWNDMGNYYGAGPSGLVLYDNMLRYYFKTGYSAGTKTTYLGTFPEIPGFQFHNYISSSGGSDNSYIYGAPYSLDRFGTGTLGIRNPRFMVKGSLPDPELQFAQELLRVMKYSGITVRDSVRNARHMPWEAASVRYPNKKLVYEHKGRSIYSITWWTNMKSVNLFAEQLLCLTGYAYNGNGSTDNGADRLISYWTGKIPVYGMFLKDGSGLSRSNAISPRHFCDLLKYMTGSKNFDSYYSTLPVAGVSGTLSSVCKNQPGEGRVHAKSGTMNRIKSYSGYVDALSGKRIAFSFIVNNYNCPADAVVDRMEKVFNGMVYVK
jgi:serine-type D-Ala-D-Ala carboxypeptidase/endopeptidase (penicillin-binding protein 4)